MVEPAPMLAASTVAKISRAGRRRPATKNPSAERAFRETHQPTAISRPEYAARTTRCGDIPG